MPERLTGQPSCSTQTKDTVGWVGCSMLQCWGPHRGSAPQAQACGSSWTLQLQQDNTAALFKKLVGGIASIRAWCWGNKHLGPAALDCGLLCGHAGSAVTDTGAEACS